MVVRLHHVKILLHLKNISNICSQKFIACNRKKFFFQENELHYEFFSLLRTNNANELFPIEI